MTFIKILKLEDFGCPVWAVWLTCSQKVLNYFKLFGFPIFQLWVYLIMMKVIPETCCAHKIRCFNWSFWWHIFLLCFYIHFNHCLFWILAIFFDQYFVYVSLLTKVLLIAEPCKLPNIFMHFLYGIKKNRK